jgi:phosphoesterase RecJ-like protein
MQNFTQLKELLSTPRDILITSHRNPDGDAVGSSLALMSYLKSKFHTVYVSLPSEFPDNFSWMEGSDEILIYDVKIKKVNKIIDNVDLVFALDYNGLSRIDKMGEYIGKSKVPVAMIDHHLNPEDFSEYTLSDPSASSTCELVFDFIKMMDKDAVIDQTVAEAIYTGILTDTGSFKYSVSPKLFNICAQLIESGVNADKLQGLIFNSLPKKNLELLGYCLNQRMEIIPELKTGIISLTKKDYENFDIQRGDTEGIVNYLLMLKEVQIAAFVSEQPKIVKLSLRSKGDFAVNEIANKHFKGGGHKNAAGGASFSGLHSTINKLKRILREEVNENSFKSYPVESLEGYQ